MLYFDFILYILYIFCYRMFIFFDVLARLRVALWDWEFVHYWRILWLFARRMWLLLLLVWL